MKTGIPSSNDIWSSERRRPKPKRSLSCMGKRSSLVLSVDETCLKASEMRLLPNCMRNPDLISTAETASTITHENEETPPYGVPFNQKSSMQLHEKLKQIIRGLHALIDPIISSPFTKSSKTSGTELKNRKYIWLSRDSTLFTNSPIWMINYS